MELVLGFLGSSRWLDFMGMSILSHVTISQRSKEGQMFHISDLEKHEVRVLGFSCIFYQRSLIIRQLFPVKDFFIGLVGNDNSGLHKQSFINCPL